MVSDTGTEPSVRTDPVLPLEIWPPPPLLPLGIAAMILPPLPCSSSFGLRARSPCHTPAQRWMSDPFPPVLLFPSWR